MSCGKPCECRSYKEHLMTIGVSADATPTRRSHIADTNERERVLAKDLAAYKRMRREGLQPASLHGSAGIEKVATERHHIEGGSPSAA